MVVMIVTMMMMVLVDLVLMMMLLEFDFEIADDFQCGGGGEDHSEAGRRQVDAGCLKPVVLLDLVVDASRSSLSVLFGVLVDAGCLMLEGRRAAAPQLPIARGGETLAALASQLVGILMSEQDSKHQSPAD